MAKTILNVRTDTEVKERARRIAGELGVPLSMVVNAFLKEFIREQRVTFACEPQLRPKVARLLKEASEDYRKRRNISPAFATAEEMDAYLDP